MSTLKYWLWLSALKGLRPKARNLLLDCFGGVAEVFFAGEAEYRDVEGLAERDISPLLDKSLYEASRIMDECTEKDIRILTMQDAEYPRRLMGIYDPPVVLYARGRLPVIDEEAAVAIVGTRKATPYGVKMARRLGYDIARGGGVVVSGLAEGIDGAAAEGALRALGRVVGVVGTAIDVVYPRMHARLFEDVIATGALLSEYPPGYPTMPGNFPVRNRIISGISVGVAVIEAPRKSGALITAARALEQGRDLFVVPANADAPNSEGSNELMRDCAAPVTSGRDIILEYMSRFPEKLTDRMPNGTAAVGAIPSAPVAKTEAEKKETGEGFAKFRAKPIKKVVDKEKSGEYIDLRKQLEALSEAQLKLVSVMTAPSMHVDDIIELSGLAAKDVLTELTMLELMGFVSQQRGKRFTLKITNL